MGLISFIFCCCRKKQEIDFDIDANIDWTEYNIKYKSPIDNQYRDSFRYNGNYIM